MQENQAISMGNETPGDGKVDADALMGQNQPNNSEPLQDNSEKVTDNQGVQSTPDKKADSLLTGDSANEEKTLEATNQNDSHDDISQHENKKTVQEHAGESYLAKEKEVGIPENWKEALVDDLKDSPSLKNFKSVNDLAKSYVNAQKMIGHDKVAIPSKHATPDEWQEVYKKLGLPESSDGYEVEELKDLGLSEEDQKALKEQAHKTGIFPHQLKDLAKFQKETLSKYDESFQQKLNQEQEQGINNLKQEWGNAFDKNVNMAKRALKRFGDQKTVEFLEKSGLGNNPEIIKVLAKAGETIQEDQIVGEGGFSSVKTPQEAQKEVDKIMGDTNHPYHKKDHPSHSAAVKEVQDLFAQIYPKQS